MAFQYRRSSNAVLPSSINNNQENVEMNNQIIDTNSSAVINQENGEMNNVLRNAFDTRRKFVPNQKVARLNYTAEEIKDFSPMGIFMDLLEKGKIGITSDANATRKSGQHAIYMNPVQDKQFGAALALFEELPYRAFFIGEKEGERKIALFDTTGDQDRVVVESSPEGGYTHYDVYNAVKAFNDDGKFAGMQPTDMNLVQKGIQGALEGWDDENGHHINGYNEWVTAHNEAAKAIAMGIATADQLNMIEERPVAGQENLFVQQQNRHHINYNSIVNKYAIVAWLLLGEKKPAFELVTFAKTYEQFETFINNRESNIVKGYQNQIRRLSGIEYVAQTAE